MKYCLLGRKLGHSYSCDIHRAMGLDYSLVEKEPEELASLFGEGYDGFNVTIPYKRDIIPFLDEMTETARAIGAVNTVVKRNGKLFGDNTDIAGLEYLFARKGVDISGKNVLILGTGGTSETARYLMKKKNARSVKFVSRTGEINYENCYDKAPETQIIVNATPVGMYPNIDKSPVDTDGFSHLEFIADCVYNPLKTELLSNAENSGILCSNGLSMLVCQALYAEAIWTGEEKRKDRAEEILRKLYRQKANIVLYGMPSCGKSTVGKELAAQTGKPFVDSDVYIAEKTGKTPEEIILGDGEKAFRKAESEAIEELSLRSGIVLSVGGGSVLKKENVRALRRNGILIYIKRDLSLLSSDGRPLSKQCGAARLYEERKEIYEGVKDCETENNGTIDDCVRRILSRYENTCDKRC